MQEINNFTSEILRKETGHYIWKNEIKWIITVFKPIQKITLEELLNELGKWKGTNKKYISINYNDSNTDLKEITDIEDLKKYFKDEISELFSIEDKNWEIYYDITVKPDKLKEAKEKFKNFELKDKPTEPEPWIRRYRITPKDNMQLTINDLIAEISTIPDKNPQICVNSSELEDSDYHDINKIPEEYLNLIITGGSVRFWEKCTYYCITWFTENNLTSEK